MADISWGWVISHTCQTTSGRFDITIHGTEAHHTHPSQVLWDWPPPWRSGLGQASNKLKAVLIHTVTQPPTQLCVTVAVNCAAPDARLWAPLARPISTLETRRLMRNVMQIPATSTSVRHSTRDRELETLVDPTARLVGALVVGITARGELAGRWKQYSAAQESSAASSDRKRQWCGLLARRDNKVTRPAGPSSRLFPATNEPRRQMDPTHLPSGLKGGHGREG